jgi:hypothetical protein
MFIEIVPNRTSPPAVLLRESYREGGKVKKRTLANLSKLPLDVVEGLRTLLKGGVAFGSAGEALEIRRALPHGHVSAVLGTLRALGLERLIAGGKLDPAAARLKDLALAMIVARVVAPGSKLSTLRALTPETASSSLGLVLGLAGEKIEIREIYAALDWLGERQDRIETRLAKQRLGEGTLVLYDVSSSYLEGRCCELARFGYSRDKRRDRPQIVYGLLCDRHGCPLAIEAFSGETGDPTTLQAQVDKLKDRFGLDRVVLVGDRGMITEARIAEDLKPAGLDWITALRAPQIQALAEQGQLQLDLFDERDLAAITAPAFPGERLVVCRNAELAKDRRRKRADLLAATERALSRIVLATRRKRRPLRGQAAIGLDVGAVIDKHKIHHHRRQLHLPAPQRGHRSRGPARRPLCHPHQPAARDHGRRGTGQKLQVPGPGRACLSLAQKRRPADPAGLPLAGAPGPSPSLLVHAGLSRRMAHARTLGADPLCRARQGQRRNPTPFHRRSRGSLPGDKAQAQPPQDRPRHPARLLPRPAAPPGEPDPQHRHHPDQPQ